jgi:broad specificity phosphatase PhoE
MPAQTTTFLLVRHGQTKWNVEGRWQGQQNSDLTAKGISDAKLLGLRLWHDRDGIGAFYTSDLGRTVETTDCINDALGMAYRKDRRLREKSFGIFEGLTGEEGKDSAFRHHQSSFSPSMCTGLQPKPSGCSCACAEHRCCCSC